MKFVLQPARFETQVCWGCYKQIDTSLWEWYHPASEFTAIPVARKYPMSQRLDVFHYGDVIMGAMASQITSVTIVYSTVYSDADEKTSKCRVTGLCAGNLPASNAENVSIWWRLMYMPDSCRLRTALTTPSAPISGACPVLQNVAIRGIIVELAPLTHLLYKWRHNGRDSGSNHQPHDCLLKRLFRRRSKKTSKLRVTGLCAGNSPGNDCVRLRPSDAYMSQ